MLRLFQPSTRIWPLLENNIGTMSRWMDMRAICFKLLLCFVLTSSARWFYRCCCCINLDFNKRCELPWAKLLERLLRLASMAFETKPLHWKTCTKNDTTATWTTCLFITTVACKMSIATAIATRTILKITDQFGVFLFAQQFLASWSVCRSSSLDQVASKCWKNIFALECAAAF